MDLIKVLNLKLDPNFLFQLARENVINKRSFLVKFLMKSFSLLVKVIKLLRKLQPLLVIRVVFQFPVVQNSDKQKKFVLAFVVNRLVFH